MVVFRVGLDARRAVQLPAAILLFPLPLLCKGATKHQLALVATGAVVIATTFCGADCMRRWWLKTGRWYHQGVNSNLCLHCGRTRPIVGTLCVQRTSDLCGICRGGSWLCLIQGSSGQRATRWMVALSCLGCALLMLRACFTSPPRLLHHALRACIGLACRCRIGSATSSMG